ncbi:hypothetical protein JCM19231_3711 [Vibrio ishigakensis]|uniref:Uncharacterized protein n=1 Tax=Vibrio ishigakensis TaxID=1481914 RepID=A0A0B8NZW9_9VIBR|nr:hypothetical protein JCM19231_3711 [Vibrio ishigakensis]
MIQRSEPLSPKATKPESIRGKQYFSETLTKRLLGRVIFNFELYNEHIS